MTSSDRTHYQLSELIECAQQLEATQRERDAAIDRAARLQAEVTHLHNALWLQAHPEAKQVPTIDPRPTETP